MSKPPPASPPLPYPHSGRGHPSPAGNNGFFLDTFAVFHHPIVAPPCHSHFPPGEISSWMDVLASAGGWIDAALSTDHKEVSSCALEIPCVGSSCWDSWVC